MIISVDLTKPSATVLEPEVLTAFSVASSTIDDVAVAAAMGAAGEAAGDAHVWVSADWIRDDVSGRVDDGWSGGFDKMLEFATTKGWLNDAGTHIKGHIEVADS